MMVMEVNAVVQIHGRHGIPVVITLRSFDFSLLGTNNLKII